MNIKKGYLLFIVFLLLTGVFTATYAYFGVNVIGDQAKSTVVHTGKVELIMDDALVSTNYIPFIYDSYYKVQAYKKEFTFSNPTATLNECVSIYINISNISAGIKNSFFKYSLENSSGIVLSSGSLGDIIINTDYLLYDGVFMNANDSKTFYLYLWYSYDDDQNQSSIENSTFTANIIGSATDSMTSNTCSSN